MIINKKSISIMISNKMRIILSELGYSKEDMIQLSLADANNIIEKGVPKIGVGDKWKMQ